MGTNSEIYIEKTKFRARHKPTITYNYELVTKHLQIKLVRYLILLIITPSYKHLPLFAMFVQYGQS